MKNKNLKKKILFDLRLLIFLIPSIIFGWCSLPWMENPLFKMPSIINGMICGIGLLIAPYLIISWLFYDYWYKEK